MIMLTIIKMRSLPLVAKPASRRRVPRLNPDGISVEGCDYIYAPGGEALEYSALAANPYRGCGHKCTYCFVPQQIHIKRAVFNAGAKERRDYLARLTRDAKKYQALGVTEQVMLSFTTDPYHPGDSSLTPPSIKVLIEHGLGLCTLTKGGTRSLRDLSLFRRDRDSYAATLTSLDDRFSRKWERGAALPGDRLKALQVFHDAGIFTWASLEPTIDVESSLQIVRETHSFVDLYKIGRANYLKITKTTDWESYTHRMIELCQKLAVKHYIKKDLQPYLPAGHYNPLRVPQHQ
jgi:DNA repair photolyase